MARYSLFVLKVPLYTNQPTVTFNQLAYTEVSLLRCDVWMVFSVSN